MASAEITSPPMASANASATAVLPDAVGPKSARTERSAAGLPDDGFRRKLDFLGRPHAGREGEVVLLRMILPMTVEPFDCSGNAFRQRDGRGVSEELPCLRGIRDVVRHLAE